MPPSLKFDSDAEIRRQQFLASAKKARLAASATSGKEAAPILQLLDDQQTKGHAAIPADGKGPSGAFMSPIVAGGASRTNDALLPPNGPTGPNLPPAPTVGDIGAGAGISLAADPNADTSAIVPGSSGQSRTLRSQPLITTAAASDPTTTTSVVAPETSQTTDVVVASDDVNGYLFPPCSPAADLIYSMNKASLLATLELLDVAGWPSPSDIPTRPHASQFLCHLRGKGSLTWSSSAGTWTVNDKVVLSDENFVPPWRQPILPVQTAPVVTGASPEQPVDPLASGGDKPSIAPGPQTA